MKIPQSQRIEQQDARQFLSQVAKEGLEITYLLQKHQVLIEKGSDWLAKLFLPWTRRWDEETAWVQEEDTQHCLVLVRAGQAAVGYFHRGELLDHKVFRAYMVRQKQGKSQFKYLKTKGKSRSGSRIRLTETQLFFNEINERLQQYESQYPIDFWGISCSKTLWPLLMHAEVAAPFQSAGSQLIELPYHIAQASYEELQQVGQLLTHFHLLLSPLGKELFATNTTSELDVEEDW